MKAKKATKFTFKKQPRETGLAAVGMPYPNTDIKLNGQIVGTIYAPTWQTSDRLWRASFMVRHKPTENDPCPFRWVIVATPFESEPAAREALNKSFGRLVRMGLYWDEEEER